MILVSAASMTTQRSSSFSNVTPTIEELNYERRLFQLPVVVTMGVIMVAAIFGNILVIYVYSKRRVSPSTLFILLLAVGDLTSSSLCIPFQIFDLSNPYQYPVPVACKIFRFLETLVNIWCGLILMCIAFDRYFKICHPLQTYTMGKAKSLVVVMLALTLSLSWPQLFLVGKRTVATSVKGVFGEDCSTQDAFFGSIYSLLFQGAISILFGICMVIFLLFYGRIFLVVWRRKHQLIGERYSFRSSSLSEKTTKGADDKNKIPLSMIRSQSNENGAFSFDKDEKCTLRSVKDDVSEDGECRTFRSKWKNAKSILMSVNDLRETTLENGRRTSSLATLNEIVPGTPTSPRSGLKISSRVKIRTSRTTLMFALVTLAGVIGFLPYLLVEVLRQSGVAFQPGMTEAEDMMYEFFSKSYFLNNIANPVIYSVMNPVFRKESRVGLRKLMKCSKD